MLSCLRWFGQCLSKAIVAVVQLLRADLESAWICLDIFQTVLNQLLHHILYVRSKYMFCITFSLVQFSKTFKVCTYLITVVLSEFSNPFKFRQELLKCKYFSILNWKTWKSIIFHKAATYCETKSNCFQLSLENSHNISGIFGNKQEKSKIKALLIYLFMENL